MDVGRNQTRGCTIMAQGPTTGYAHELAGADNRGGLLHGAKGLVRSPEQTRGTKLAGLGLSAPGLSRPGIQGAGLRNLGKDRVEGRPESGRYASRSAHPI